jgi:DNA-3-methyladenine glycosylase II
MTACIILSRGSLSKALSVINNELMAFQTGQPDEHHLHTAHYPWREWQPFAGSCWYTIHYVDWLDLDRDIAPFYHLLRKNKVLSYMAADFSGLRLISIHDLYEALCWSIIGQQINLTFAYTLKRRLVEHYGQSIVVERAGTLYVFPRPEVLQYVTVADLRALQFSERKAEYVLLVSKLFAEGSISKQHVLQCGSYEEQVALLTAIRGIGVWTANYVLMKSLKQLQAITYGDVGLLNALLSHELIKDKKDTAGIDRLFKKFKGWESYLVFYLWRSLAAK